MKITRREVIATAAASPLLAAASAPAIAASAPPSTKLPAKALFAAMPFTYLDAGSTHPMSLGAKAALEAYLRYKTQDGTTPGYDMSAKEEAVLAAFGKLVGATPDELCFIQSTTMGENLVLQALDLPRAGGRIVTDVLHFFGSFYTYGELDKAGVEVVTLPMQPGGWIAMSEMAAAINERTKLVAISHVSTINGFEHDLKQICDFAHAHGAYVYADIVHAAGAVPVDLRETGVDFASCSSYKWLMGDFGLGFLYVRKEVQDKVRRPWLGYHQVDSFATHVFPYDDPQHQPHEGGDAIAFRGSEVATYSAAPNASGRFAMGTTSWTGVVQLEHSLAWLDRVGVTAIQAWRQPMIDAVQKELRRRGYEPLTPEGSRSSLVAFGLQDARGRLNDRLDAAKVRITLSRNRFRVSVGVFNDMNDIDKLLNTLPKTPPK
jgi:selenocysteine lyase/cysteine desulfurase